MRRLIVLLSLVGLPACSSRPEPGTAQGPREAAKPNRKKVVRTDEEWAKVLPRESYLVTRTGATEPRGSGKYTSYHGEGIFACICCGAEIFDARAKYDSGTGWPSFTEFISAERIDVIRAPHDPIEYRTEVRCATCDAHLGHVFDDGPPPAGLRYCINSAALSLVEPPAGDTTKPASHGDTGSAP